MNGKRFNVPSEIPEYKPADRDADTNASKREVGSPSPLETPASSSDQKPKEVKELEISEAQKENSAALKKYFRKYPFVKNGGVITKEFGRTVVERFPLLKHFSFINLLKKGNEKDLLVSLTRDLGAVSDQRQELLGIFPEAEQKSVLTFVEEKLSRDEDIDVEEEEKSWIQPWLTKEDMSRFATRFEILSDIEKQISQAIKTLEARKKAMEEAAKTSESEDGLKENVA